DGGARAGRRAVEPVRAAGRRHAGGGVRAAAVLQRAGRERLGDAGLGARPPPARFGRGWPRRRHGRQPQLLRHALRDRAAGGGGGGRAASLLFLPALGLVMSGSRGALLAFVAGMFVLWTAAALGRLAGRALLVGSVAAGAALLMAVGVVEVVPRGRVDFVTR